MIRILFFVFILFFSLGCSSDNAQNTELKELLQRQKELRQELKQISEDIAKLEQTSTANALPLVQVEILEKKPFHHFIELQGYVKSDYALELYPELGGKVEEVLVREGDYVEKGKVLVRLDTDISDEQIKEIVLNLEFATLQYERQSVLYEKGVGTEIEYKRIKTEKEALEKKKKALELQRQKSLILAPFSGYVDLVHTKAGEMSNPQMALVRLVDLQKIKIEVEVSEMYLGKIKEGSRADLYFPALGLSLDEQKVSHASKFIHAQNRTYTLQISLDNKNQKILPNLLARVKLEDFALPSTLVVPSKIIMYNNRGDAYLFVYKDGKVYKRIVEVGLDYKNEQHILSGLEAGEMIVIEGYQALTEGDMVKILEQ